MEALADRLRAWLTPSMAFTFVLFASLPLWIEGVGLYSYLALEILIWCLYALGFNLLLGYTGLPSFGHGAFFGIGAYAMGLTQFYLVENLWAGLAMAILAGLAAGGAVALFISHRRGIYFALMTIAFGEVFFFIASKWTSVTGGEDGLLNIARLPLSLGPLHWELQENYHLYYFALAVFVVAVLLMWRLVHSPFGKVLQAIRQNENRTRFLGYPVWLYKWASFTLSAGVAGLAGGLFAMAQESAYVQVMNLQWNGIIVLMTLIGGGMVSFWGPVVGAIVFFLARDLLGALTQTWLLWYGLMFMAIIMFKPEGLAGLYQDLLRRVRPLGQRRSASLSNVFWR
jgi:branched-chain amino acid transport system permease protein